ncbi:MAG: ribosomal protein S18-alanine N-acetyltransferase [Zoogloeaceae bacterium]|jgi:ribosomal-protein-alanine N-acetyltransferase|nr:ribosomal protein S18-alanine N-acetyltransferase [Zoogloeaceae bacterium]
MNAILKRSEPDFAPMRLEDVDAVLALEQRAYRFPWTRANFTDSLAAGYSAWCCRRDGELIGYALVMMALDEAHLLNITVAPDWQRRGYGLLIMRHLFDVARSHGGKHMFLEVRPSNAAGQGLYARLGFKTIGRRKGYYPAGGAREDAVVMTLTL